MQLWVWLLQTLPYSLLQSQSRPSAWSASGKGKYRQAFYLGKSTEVLSVLKVTKVKVLVMPNGPFLSVIYIIGFSSLMHSYESSILLLLIEVDLIFTTLKLIYIYINVYNLTLFCSALRISF